MIIPLMEQRKALIVRLIPIALITIPLIAFIGVTPFASLTSADRETVIFMAVIISLNNAMIWAVNLLLVRFLRGPHWLLYVSSYALVFAANFVLRQGIDISPFIEVVPVRSFLFPLLNTAVINTIVLVIIALRRSREQNRRDEMTIAQLRIENLEAQKQSLVRQMRPHFLFNSLSTLKSLIGEQRDAAETYVVKLSNFLRYSFTQQTQDLSTVDQELAFTLNYIDLQAVRFEDAFTCEIDVPEAVRVHKLPIFALQTLVENVFKHNYFSAKRPLRFSIRHEGDWLVVWNEKVGLKLTERNETGLANLNRRYELTNGSNIVVEDGETSFTVKIPIISV